MPPVHPTPPCRLCHAEAAGRAAACCDEPCAMPPAIAHHRSPSLTFAHHHSPSLLLPPPSLCRYHTRQSMQGGTMEASIEDHLISMHERELVRVWGVAALYFRVVLPTLHCAAVLVQPHAKAPLYAIADGRLFPWWHVRHKGRRDEGDCCPSSPCAPSHAAAAGA